MPRTTTKPRRRTAAPPKPRRYVENGKRLAAFRELRGMSQGQAARAVGFERDYWTKIENGKAALASYKNRTKVAEALGLTLPDLDALWSGEVGPRVLHKRLTSGG